VKVLAALALLAVIAPQARAQCGLPANFTNSAEVEEGDLKVILASDRELYAPGDSVLFCLIVQNHGSTTFSVNWHIDPQDGLFVMPEACTAVTLECFTSAVFVHPRIVQYFSAGTTLAPGECRAWMRVWDTAVFPAPEARYNVLGGMFDPHPAVDSPIGRFRVPSNGVLLRVTLGGSTSVTRSGWDLIKKRYR
jgi:hypothetical protein